jgi:hypothetical protein
LVKIIANNQVGKKTENQEKSGKNVENQLLKSGDFLSGEKSKTQESSGQIRRFGKPAQEIYEILLEQTIGGNENNIFTSELK